MSTNNLADLEVLHERALALARQDDSSEPIGKQLELFCFRIHDETFGFDARYSREVFRMKQYTRVPCTPDFVMGVTNYQGEFYSLIDLGRFFERPRLAFTNLNQVIAIDAPEMAFGFVVDEPLGILSVSADSLRDAPYPPEDMRTPFITGITLDGIVYLDLQAIIASNRLHAGRAKRSGMIGGSVL